MLPYHAGSACWSFSTASVSQATEAHLCLQVQTLGALRRELSQESLQHGSRSAVSLPTASTAEEAAGAAGSRDSSQPPSPALQQTRTAAQRPAGGDSSLLAALPAGVPVEGGLAPAEMAQLMAMVERLEEELFSSETMRNGVEVGRGRPTISCMSYVKLGAVVVLSKVRQVCCCCAGCLRWGPRCCLGVMCSPRAGPQVFLV